MRWRWYYLKRTLRANRVLLPVLFSVLTAAMLLWNCRSVIFQQMKTAFQRYGVQAAGRTMKGLAPALAGEETKPFLAGVMKNGNVLLSVLEELEEPEFSEDPAYEKLLARAGGKRPDGGGAGKEEAQSGARKEEAQGGAEQEEAQSGAEQEEAQGGARQGEAQGGAGKVETQSGAGQEEMQGGPSEKSEAAAAAVPEELTAQSIASRLPARTVIREKLADYDYLMSNFYSVHPTTTAGRELMNAEKFLKMDFTVEKKEEPQILIYHTHSREEFADYPENPEAVIPGVGTYLTELLEAKGYQVIHDTGVYDLQDGKLDRSKAYTYALDGITGILQKYPSIEVVLDLHRDGVKAGTRLVQEINGKPTARIMFFNGTSQTPDGPIEYLPNPNRDFNLGFSFQMQLAAAERYPGLTRKIYLKGLRYNEHVRARSALIEVGAQTNTYEEALNAMEPLAEILDAVLSGE